MIYLYHRTIVNRLKKALRRPVTYIYVVGIAAYLIMMISAFGSMAMNFGINSPQGFATILSLGIFYLLPADIISYSKRKGLLFRPSEVHFVFPSPEIPKKILLFAGMKSFLVLVVTAILVVVFGIFYFGMDPWRMGVFFLFFAILENTLEGCMIVICYGNETLPTALFKVITGLLYAMMAVFSLVAIYMLSTRGIHAAVINEYLSLPIIQIIPIIGWAIAFVQLIILGPTTVNVICTVLYCSMVVLLLIYARKMKCTGEFYEDAMTFADDYQLRRSKAKKGEITFGKKKYMKKATVEYKGTYAKAIYYRQMLEYKKNRFFIFGWNSLLCLGIGVAIAVVAYFTDLQTELAAGVVFIIPTAMAYLLFMFSGYATKWSKELQNPYTYLIPDSGIRKLWFATKIEHQRAMVDGCLITIPGAIILGLNPIVAILTVMIYVCLSANRLYMNMLAEAIIGNVMGATGKNILKMILQALAMTFSIIAAVALGITLGYIAGFIGMIIVTIVITFAGAFGASIAFDRMESYD